MGVFYHLRHPLLALDLIREHVADDLMLFQTMQQGSSEIADVPEDHPFYIPGTCKPPAYFNDPGYPKMHFIERSFANDWTNWWAPNAACSQALIRAAGFTIEASAKATSTCAVWPLCLMQNMAPPPSTQQKERCGDRSGDDLERAQQQVALGPRR
jgi:hypothetical protein